MIHQRRRPLIAVVLFLLVALGACTTPDPGPEAETGATSSAASLTAAPNGRVTETTGEGVDHDGVRLSDLTIEEWAAAVATVYADLNGARTDVRTPFTPGRRGASEEMAETAAQLTIEATALAAAVAALPAGPDEVQLNDEYQLLVLNLGTEVEAALDSVDELTRDGDSLAAELDAAPDPLATGYAELREAFTAASAETYAACASVQSVMSALGVGILECGPPPT